MQHWVLFVIIVAEEVARSQFDDAMSFHGCQPHGIGLHFTRAAELDAVP